ncbi:MAG: GNAT family N-acetyltransferase [Candidatus Malihini olakiniferum]
MITLSHWQLWCAEVCVAVCCVFYSPSLAAWRAGKTILGQLIHEARHWGDSAIWLEVITSNAAGIALYDGMGFIRQETVYGFIAPISGEVSTQET